MAVFVARQAGSTFKLDAPPPPPTQPIGSEPTGMQTARPLRAVGPTFSDLTILGTKGMCC